MTRIVTNLNLTKSQAEVLVKIHQASTPHLAKSETESSEKAIAASGTLLDIGAIDITPESAEVLPAGERIMRDEGLIDDGGELTKTAEQLWLGDDVRSKPPEKSKNELGNKDVIDDLDLDLNLEGWSMIHEMNNITNLKR